MAIRSLKRVFYSVISPSEYDRSKKNSNIIVSVQFPERKFWNQCITGSELIIFSSTIPTNFMITKVHGRGILATPYYMVNRPTLIIYFTIESFGVIPTREIFFRLSSGQIAPLNDLTFYSELREYTTVNAEALSPRREPDDLTPYQFPDGSEFRVSDGEHDASSVRVLAEDHPFGVAQGHFEFVLTQGSNVIGAIQIISGESEKYSHHIQRLIFKENYPKIFKQSLTISRMYGRKI